MSVRREPPKEERSPRGLLSLRSLVLLTLTLVAGALAFFHPHLGVPLAAGAAVLGLLHNTIGD